MNANRYNQWQWQETENGSYLTCQLLADWQHGFFSNHFPQQSPVDLIAYLNPDAQVYRLKQIHSSIVHSTDKIDQQTSLQSQSELLQGDGIITSKPLQSVWSASADCTPVLIADRVTGKVAAIHSGWRGTASQIVAKAIALFLSQGSNKDNLLFALGPAIEGKVYQVKEDVAIKVVQTVIADSENMTDKQIITQAIKLPSSVLLADNEEGKYRLDVTQTINLQIQQQGISSEQIAIAPYCTYQTPEHFFSYRRSHEKKNQWSGIISR